MNRIRVDDVHRKWLKDPKYRAAFEAQREEFELASVLIAARGRAGLTQAELAKRMRTTQAAVARMESGRSSPSTRTLRRVAEATGTRLKISFQAQKRG